VSCTLFVLIMFCNMCVCFCNVHLLTFSVFCLGTYLYCFVVILLLFFCFLCFVVFFVLLCIFIFVCTSVGLLPPGESPIAVSNNHNNNLMCCGFVSIRTNASCAIMCHWSPQL
jgi:hypothetical protein